MWKVYLPTVSDWSQDKHGRQGKSVGNTRTENHRKCPCLSHIYVHYIFQPLLYIEGSKWQGRCIGDWFALSSSHQQGQTVCLSNVVWSAQLGLISPASSTFFSHSEQQFTNVIFINTGNRRRRAGLGERKGIDASRHLAPERGADGWQNTEGTMAKDSHSPFNWVGPESSSKASQPFPAYNLHKIMLCTLSNWLSILRMQSNTPHKSASSVFLCKSAVLLGCYYMYADNTASSSACSPAP